MSSFLLLETTRNAALYRKYSDQAYVTNLMSVNQKTTLQRRSYYLLYSG